MGVGVPRWLSSSVGVGNSSSNAYAVDTWYAHNVVDVKVNCNVCCACRVGTLGQTKR